MLQDNCSFNHLSGSAIIVQAICWNIFIYILQVFIYTFSSHIPSFIFSLLCRYVDKMLAIDALNATPDGVTPDGDGFAVMGLLFMVLITMMKRTMFNKAIPKIKMVNHWGWWLWQWFAYWIFKLWIVRDKWLNNNEYAKFSSVILHFWLVVISN